ncbi:MAG TPA: Uma2 family endonuclease [Saprospiraceae bacterium]|nr:Uma2 family endonuclease [Saprospiraceae bacterium]HMQ85025.1 Uma2 family endonuclease [Saprospiraceae bacterium]
MSSAVKTIPGHYIYELDEGKPIYYKGYKQDLSQNINLDPKGSSLLQSLIITQLVVLLHQKLSDQYHILTNELGLQLSKGNRRAADIAIFEKKQLSTAQIANKYTNVPPKVVIEIDTKAEIEVIQDTFAYYNRKTEQLLGFGVKKVIWVFTDTQKVLIASPEQDWQLINWSKEIEIWDEVYVVIPNLLP